MEEEILKGNFKVQRPVKADKAHEGRDKTVREELKERALASLGGSMVFMDPSDLAWDGDD